MDAFQFDPAIADAIIRGRILRLPTLRATAEKAMGRLDNGLWQRLEPRWKWHDAMTKDELERHLQR